MDAAAPTVTVAIASMGRPTLARTLASVMRQDLPEGAALDVVVADDSMDGSARRLVENEGDGPWPVRVIDVASRNIATARNAALEAATGTFIAWIDDDEWAEKDWLRSLLACAEAHDADAVFGPADAVYPDDAPAWAERVGVYRKRPGRTGERVETGSTSNALLRRASVGELRFRERFGQTGGEDTDFFNRLARGGAKLVASAEGHVTEDVPPERLHLRHLRQRYTRGGHTYAAITNGEASRLDALRFYGASAAKLALSGLGAVAVSPVRRDLAVSLALKSWLNYGKLLYGAGRPSPRIY